MCSACASALPSGGVTGKPPSAPAGASSGTFGLAE